jgi:general secretion pathway protein C
MDRLLEVWSRTAGRASPRAVLAGLEVVLVVLLAVQAARLTWLFVEPADKLSGAASGRPAVIRPVDLSVLARFDPFFRVADAGSAAPAGAGGALQLFGVRSDGRGGGSAILGPPGGPQGSYLVGESVAPGLVLRAVAADHVILSRSGAAQRLEFAAPASAPASTAGEVAPPPPPPAEPSARLDPRQFLAAAALTPRTANGQVSGYRLAGRGKGDVLARAGLQDGDVLLSVEGNPLNPERMSELPELLAQSNEVEIRFERNGQIMTTRLRMAGR